MSKTNFRQRDLERIFRAAKAIGATVQIDLKTLSVTVIPTPEQPTVSPQGFAPDGKENWDDDPDPPIQPPLDHREARAMERLVAAGIGVMINSCSIRLFGPHSQQKLLERGYIEVSPGQIGKYNNDDISLTKKGWSDWQAQQRHIERYPSL
ncbi:hypothetical protein [Agrobacterium tumefaciens]|uniref:hypothetical protein n=1 Tax=Agrobacterium tumefaciens TaxID=358 RepID=UPI001146FD6E